MCARETGKKNPCRSTECLPPIKAVGRARTRHVAAHHRSRLERTRWKPGAVLAAGPGLPRFPSRAARMGRTARPRARVPKWKAPSPRGEKCKSPRCRGEKRFPEKENRAGEGEDGRRSLCSLLGDFIHCPPVGVSSSLEHFGAAGCCCNCTRLKHTAEEEVTLRLINLTLTLTSSIR